LSKPTIAGASILVAFMLATIRMALNLLGLQSALLSLTRVDTRPA
jgi:hypothetical protein